MKQEEKWTKEKINKQLKKEAVISVGLYILFFLWWYVTGYVLADYQGVENYTYVLGMPLWFFLSSVVGYIIFSIATIIVVKMFFKDIPLEFENEQEDKK